MGYESMRMIHKCFFTYVLGGSLDFLLPTLSRVLQ